MSREAAFETTTKRSTPSGTAPTLRTGLRAALVLGGMLTTFGCLASPLELQPLTVTLTADPVTAVVGQEIEFFYTTRGSNIEGTVLDYGNGQSETIPYIYTGRAPVNIQTQTGRFDHAYDQAGTFVARATVTDVAGAEESAEVTIQVVEP